MSIRDFGSVANSYSDLTVLFDTQSQRHHIGLYHHPELGAILVIDDEVQHVEAWTPLYHEPLIHLPSAFIKKVTKTLILGGGSLFAAFEVLKYRSVERILMVDHDPRVTEICSEYYPSAKSAILDPRLEIMNADIYRGLYEIDEKFDLIINDAVDLMKTQPSEMLRQFDSLLNRGGVCADVLYRHIFCKGQLASRWFKLLRKKEDKRRVVASLVFVPEYPGVLHLLTVWGKTKALTQLRRTPINEEQLEWASNKELCPCSYYSPNYLSYYLYLPPYLRAILNLP